MLRLATIVKVCCIAVVIIESEAQPLSEFNNVAVNTGYSGGGGGVYRGGQCCCDSAYEYGCVDWYNRRFPTIIAANRQMSMTLSQSLHCLCYDVICCGMH